MEGLRCPHCQFLEREIYRIKTHEIYSAVELDKWLNRDERVTFKAMADRIAELEQQLAERK